MHEQEMEQSERSSRQFSPAMASDKKKRTAFTIANEHELDAAIDSIK